MSALQPMELSRLVEAISSQIEQARNQVRQSVNRVMVQSYWQIGRLIVEDEQQLSKQLTERLGKGFDVGNLSNMRQFYITFPIQDAVRSELSWTHYRALIRIDNSNLQQLLLELGKGFACVERHQRIRFEDEAKLKVESYIDLVFYNFKLKCFLALCWYALLRQWQMDMYRKYGMSRLHGCQGATNCVRLYDEQRKGDDDNPTIGLVLCSEKSEAVVKYSVLADQKQLFAAKYLPYLPTEEELKRELEREREQALAQLQQQELRDE